MARNYFALHVAIWNDDDFKRLTRNLQQTYFLIASQPKLTPCGVLDYIPRRMRGLAADLTPDELDRDVRALCATRPRPYLILDDDTSELLVRSLVRYDELLKMERPAKSIASDWDVILSPTIKHAVALELRRRHLEEPDLKGWKGIEAANPELWSLIEASEAPQLKVV